MAPVKGLWVMQGNPLHSLVAYKLPQNELKAASTIDSACGILVKAPRLDTKPRVSDCLVIVIRDC